MSINPLSQTKFVFLYSPIIVTITALHKQKQLRHDPNCTKGMKMHEFGLQCTFDRFCEKDLQFPKAYKIAVLLISTCSL